jgi:hypothetical protein
MSGMLLPKAEKMKKGAAGFVKRAACQEAELQRI